MLHYRQELDVREAHLGDVVAKLMRELAIAQRPVVLVRHAPP